MSDNTRTIWMVVGLLLVVNGIIFYKHLQNQKQVDNLPDDSIVGAGVPVLLELGSHTCGPCRQMTPILVALSKEQSEFKVGYVDVGATQGAMDKYNVEAIPVQVFYDADGEELFRHVGFYPKEDILAKWKELNASEMPE